MLSKILGHIFSGQLRPRLTQIHMEIEPGQGGVRQEHCYAGFLDDNGHFILMFPPPEIRYLTLVSTWHP